MVRCHYPALFADDAVLATRMTVLATKTYELTDFLVSIAKIERLPRGRHLIGEITYHDSCTGLRELGIKQQPRTLLRKCQYLTLKEMSAAEECCGFGGAFAAKYGELSAAITARKCENIRANGAPTVVGGDLGCLLNIEGKLRRMGDETTRVLHIAEVLTGKGD